MTEPLVVIQQEKGRWVCIIGGISFKRDSAADCRREAISLLMAAIKELERTA